MCSFFFDVYYMQNDADLVIIEYESGDMMDINKILKDYDDMFGNYSLDKIEDYLVKMISLAKINNHNDVLFTLLNEMIGFCRDTTQVEKGVKYCRELKQLLDCMNIYGTYEYATCLLNLANAYRAFGQFNLSLEYFYVCEIIYKRILDEYDYGWANLYNNFGLLFQETSDYLNSIQVLYKALDVVDRYEDAYIPQAITRTNLAVSMIYEGSKENIKKALGYLKTAYDVFVKDGKKDFHFGATLTALADAYSALKQYSLASFFYKQSLFELDKHVGKNDNYNRVLDKYHYVNDMNKHKNNLDMCYDFYNEYVKDLLEDKFYEYKDRIAVGVVGEGSDCYGFDDEISRDHDLEIGLCFWLTQDDYEKVGYKLQEFYESIVTHNGFLRNRRGVIKINDFYNSLLNTNKDYEHGDTITFEDIEEYRLSASSNGRVFYDPIGIFTNIRNHILSYYPEHIHRKIIANALHDYSQYAQSNYERMMCRNDIISASLCKTKAIERTLDIVYLLNKQYAPYYKWKKKGIEHTRLGQKIIPLLEELIQLPLIQYNYSYNSSDINKEDPTIILFEKIAVIIKDELKIQGYIDNDELFLEYHISQILGERMNYINKIIELEWEMFDKTINKGGRASCQNNYPTFLIMRKSQYMTWNDALLESYYQDLINAKNKGWNLITEKYARMMESTHYNEYKEIEQYLEKRSEERIKIQEEIIKIQVNWMEQLSLDYPHIASHARILRTSHDNKEETSYETYLRGELSTYSDTTMTLYGRFIVDLLRQDKNLAYEIMNNTAKMYGYSDISDAEKKI